MNAPDKNDLTLLFCIASINSILITEILYYLQEKVYNKLSKVLEAKKLYKEEGNLNPTKEELARRVGISPEKVDRLLFVARIPISMQNTVGSETDTTFQVLYRN